VEQGGEKQRKAPDDHQNICSFIQCFQGPNQPVCKLVQVPLATLDAALRQAALKMGVALYLTPAGA
jgi:hypothetical protein